MARVTVEDCIEQVSNRFDLVLLCAHRARTIAGGAPITIDRDNDKNPVVALREVADQTIAPEDLQEELVHSIQKYVEVDEPEAEAAPMIGHESRMQVIGQDDPTRDKVIDRMTEDEFLRGLESLPPAESPNAGARSR